MQVRRKKKAGFLSTSPFFFFLFICRIECEPQGSKIFRSLTQQQPSCRMKKKHVRNPLYNANEVAPATAAALSINREPRSAQFGEHGRPGRSPGVSPSPAGFSLGSGSRGPALELSPQCPAHGGDRASATRSAGTAVPSPPTAPARRKNHKKCSQSVGNAS